MKKIYWILSIAILFAGCKKEDYTGIKQEVVEDYAELVYLNYKDSYDKAVVLKTAIEAFVANPSTTTHDAAKNAWLDSRTFYAQTEAFRFYGGPIDDEDGPEGLINAWPMDESFIDYIQSDPNTGIINDPTTYPTINAVTIVALNESGSETNISVGYHAIEFLLWGQDLSSASAGQRPHTDYINGGTASNQDRRGDYLVLCATLLVTNLGQMVDEWETGGAYRTHFTSSDHIDESIGHILRGIGALSKGELAGERMTVALNSQDQEDEHSCFSDNTHNDIIGNFNGVKNVYTCSYVKADGTTYDGTGLNDLFAESDATKNQAVMDALTDADTKVNAIPAPFDQAIINNAADVEDAINALRDLSDRIVDAALSIDVVVNTDIN